ncbi:MAG: hypothetical protein ACRCY4_01520 [Brevinema sp.]
MKILQHQTPLVLLLLGFALPVFAQPRMVIRTNQRGQIVRLTVSTNNRILRQEVIGTTDLNNAPAPQQQQQQRRQPVQPPAPAQPPAAEQAPPSGERLGAHFIGLSADLLIQSGRGLSRLSVQTDPANVNTAYGAQLPFFGSDSIGVGGGGTFTYMYVFPNYLTLHSQLEINSTGWIFAAFNLGLGARIPVGKAFFLVDGAISFGMTGATLPRVTGITPIVGTPEELLALIFMFGFRARIGIQFAMPRNSFFTLYTSYAAYPWGGSSAGGELRLNDVLLGQAIIQDAFKIGFEFSWKVDAKPKRAREQAQPQNDGYNDGY